MKQYIIIELDAGHDEDRNQRLHDDIHQAICDLELDDVSITPDPDVKDQIVANAEEYSYFLVSDIL